MYTELNLVGFKLFIEHRFGLVFVYLGSKAVLRPVVLFYNKIILPVCEKQKSKKK